MALQNAISHAFLTCLNLYRFHSGFLAPSLEFFSGHCHGLIGHRRKITPSIHDSFCGRSCPNTHSLAGNGSVQTMVDWILHRPPPACHPAEIRMAERLRGLLIYPDSFAELCFLGRQGNPDQGLALPASRAAPREATRGVAAGG
jgi:hypothetical protein